MPALDTEVLFAIDPKDKKHREAMELLTSGKNLAVPDVAFLEFQAVLRGRGRTPAETKEAILGIYSVLLKHGVTEASTIGPSLIAVQCDLESDYGLTYFDSLLAASALTIDQEIVSDDAAFDLVPGLKRIPLTHH